jgi:hypothetical protein
MTRIRNPKPTRRVRIAMDLTGWSYERLKKHAHEDGMSLERELLKHITQGMALR